jgi:hypothetical protein
MTAWRSTPGSAQERCARRASVNSLDGSVDTFATAETRLRGPGTPFHAMAASVTDRLWSIEDIAVLLDATVDSRIAR